MSAILMKMEFRSAFESVLKIITRNVSEMTSPGVQIGAHNFKKKWENAAWASSLALGISEC